MNFWKGKRVFVTGHTGFKGSWLSLWLNMLEAQVTGYSIGEDDDSLFTSAGIGQLVSFLGGDIRDLEHLADALSTSQPEVVFHMAAQSLVRASYADPVGTFSTNVMGTVNLLEAIRFTPSVKVVIIVTSDKCYENREWLWGYREHDRMGGHDPYSCSKGCAELVTSSYRRSFFHGDRVAAASVRAGNVLGGGDWSTDRIIPDIIRSLCKGKEIVVRNPLAVRPWQHVCDPLKGYMLLAEKLYTSPVKGYDEGWNFGPDEDGEKTVSWLVDYACKSWGRGASWSKDSGANPHEANYLKLDCTKARSRLGWRPLLKTGDVLDWTIEWYQKYCSGVSARNLTQSQISKYVALGESLY